VQRALTTPATRRQGRQRRPRRHRAGQLAVAVLPGHHDDPLLLALRDVG
jgi:hypothetical protein